MTLEQKAKVAELEAIGWVVVTGPDDAFNGALMMEAPNQHYYVLPDGSVVEKLP